MKIISDNLGEIEYQENEIITFQDGLYGFEDKRNYILINIADTEWPFYWLQSVEDENLSFIMTSPFLFHPAYDFEIQDKLVELLEVEKIEDINVFSLVVLKDKLEESTINLKAPILINDNSKKGKQVILTEEYPYKYELFKKNE